jgi:RecB family exonuclease
MLEFIPLENRSQIAELFAQYDPRHETWLVSDLRTKFELQEKILARDGQYVDESVLRASDLWKILLKRLEPRLRFVSVPFARSLLKSILDENEETLGVNSSAEETVMAYLDLMAPILLHPDGSSRLEEWFQTHPEASNRWRDWYLRARFCVVQLLEQHRVITAQWITPYLQNFSELENVWSTPLIVDLGGEISRVEAEILRLISKSASVKVIAPSPSWKNEFKYLLQPYEDLEGKSTKTSKFLATATPERKTEVLRFSGMLAETKNAVAQVRSWLEAQVPAENISVIAPDIEVYWPVLQAYFEQEGIRCQKDITHKIQSLPSVTRWMSLLRAKSGRLSTSDIEVSFFERQESQGLRYEDFRALFKSLYVTEDLERHELVRKVYFEQIDMSGLVPRDEFVAKALSFWSAHDTDVVQTILRELLQNALAHTRLRWKDWLSYLESIVASKEFNVARGSTDGVMVTRLMSAATEKAHHRIFLGLSEEALKVRGKTQLMGQDYIDLANDTGFYLENPEQSDLEFELRWLMEIRSQWDIFSFGATDFSGALQSPANFWMSLHAQHSNSEGEEMTVPLVTRWDELQHAKELHNRSWLEGRRADVEDRIALDLGQKKLPPLELTELPRLSASALESYLECPFIFASQRFFKLRDVPDIDLDVDHRTRGQLAHALFERLTTIPMRFDWTAEELDQLLEEIRQQKEMLFADERLWLPLKKKHIQIGLRFLKFEKNWREQFPQTTTLAREARFDFYIHPQTQEISKTPQEGAFRVSGQIDRVDGDDDGHLVIIDYKSSAGGISAHGSWLKNNNLQLLFYGWVIEQALMEDLRGEVIGLFYFLFKTLERKGFKIEDLSGVLYPASKRKDKNGTFEMKEVYLTELGKLMASTLQRVASGDISPVPADTKTCTDCEWRRLCRAPHLN